MPIQHDAYLAFLTATKMSFRRGTARCSSGKALHDTHRILTDVRHVLNRALVQREP